MMLTTIFLSMSGSTTGEEPSMLTSLLPLVAIIVVFYFFMIRPQMKKQKELRKYRENLSKGDKVVTVGGVHGKITEVKDDHVMLEISNEVVIKVDKNGLIQDTSELQQRR